MQFKKKCRDILKRYFAGDMSLADEIRANAQSDNPLARACRAELAAEGAGIMVPMEIDDDPDIRQVYKASKLDQVTVRRISNLLGSLKEIDTSKATPEVAHMLNEWQNRTVAEALGIKPITSPKPAAMLHHNVDEEMGMDTEDDDEEKSAAPNPGTNTSKTITVAIWLGENNHVVTEAVAKRVGRKMSSLFSLAFPEDEKDYIEGPDGHEHRIYDRNLAWMIERAYKGVVKEDEKAANQQAPAPAQKPAPPTQDDVNRMWGGRGQ